MDAILQRFVDFTNELPLVTVLTVGLLASPPLALVHELGHALAALGRVRGSVAVHVGADSAAWCRTIGRLQLRLNPVTLPWRMHGMCVFDATAASAADALMIALAGPAASAVAATACFALAPLLGGALHTAIIVAGLEAAATAVVCLIPMTLTERRSGGVRFATDGMVAVSALRVLAVSR